MAGRSDELIADEQRTIAVLRRSSAIEAELSKLLSNANVGRIDMKSETESAIVSLVASGILTASEVVTEIGTVPERPADQFRWLENHLQRTIDSADAALARHQAEFAGQGLRAHLRDKN